MEEAQSYLQKALEKSTEANDRRSRGRVLFNLALLASASGRHSDAASQMEDALKWYENNEDVYSHAEQAVLQYQGLGVLATTYENMAEPEKAKTCEDRVTALRDQGRITVVGIPRGSPPRLLQVARVQSRKVA